MQGSSEDICKIKREKRKVPTVRSVPFGTDFSDESVSWNKSVTVVSFLNYANGSYHHHEGSNVHEILDRWNKAMIHAAFSEHLCGDQQWKVKKE